MITRDEMSPAAIASGIVTEFCVAKGQLVGFVETTWLEERLARLIRDTRDAERHRLRELRKQSPVFVKKVE